MIQDLRGLSVKIVHNPRDFGRDQMVYLTKDVTQSGLNTQSKSLKRRKSSRKVKKPEIEVIEVTDEIRNQQQQIQEVSEQLNSILESLQQDRA